MSRGEVCGAPKMRQLPRGARTGMAPAGWPTPPGGEGSSSSRWLPGTIQVLPEPLSLQSVR